MSETHHYWTIGRCSRFTASLIVMTLAAWAVYQSKLVLAVLMLAVAKCLTEWERSVQKREASR